MAGSTSSSNSGRHSYQHQIAIPCNIWIQVDAESGAGRNPRIPKVPVTMRSNENLTKVVPKWSETSMISIGPYHFRDSHEEQKLKTIHAQKFIHESGQNIDELYPTIEQKTPELRNWYDFNVTNLNDQELMAIFFVDGCFLLNFIYCSNEEDGFTRLGLTNSEMTNIKRDVFLLETQLPYDVISLLLANAESIYRTRMENKIRDFVASHVPFPDPGICATIENLNSTNHLHLLHRLQGILFHEPESSNSPQGHEDGREMQTPAGRLEQQRRRGRSTHRRSCRTVQELRKVGVRFKPSSTGSFTDISFKPADCGTAGCLQLPTIAMNTSTMTTFLNLIAFESSNSSSANTLGVISYLCFMDSLIDSEDDVKELQAAGILHNSIGGTKEVAHFFNTVCSNVMPHPSYRNVIQKIENHVNRKAFKSRWRRWYVELMQKKFSSPWTFIALIAAILALLFAAIQACTSLYSLYSQHSRK